MLARGRKPVGSTRRRPAQAEAAESSAGDLNPYPAAQRIAGVRLRPHGHQQGLGLGASGIDQVPRR